MLQMLELSQGTYRCGFAEANRTRQRMSLGSEVPDHFGPAKGSTLGTSHDESAAGSDIWSPSTRWPERPDCPRAAYTEKGSRPIRGASAGV
jgi:hypothetical protein